MRSISDHADHRAIQEEKKTLGAEAVLLLSGKNWVSHRMQALLGEVSINPASTTSIDILTRYVTGKFTKRERRIIRGEEQPERTRPGENQEHQSTSNPSGKESLAVGFVSTARAIIQSNLNEIRNTETPEVIEDDADIKIEDVPDAIDPKEPAIMGLVWDELQKYGKIQTISPQNGVSFDEDASHYVSFQEGRDEAGEGDTLDSAAIDLLSIMTRKGEVKESFTPEEVKTRVKNLGIEISEKRGHFVAEKKYTGFLNPRGEEIFIEYGHDEASAAQNIFEELKSEKIFVAAEKGKKTYYLWNGEDFVVLNEWKSTQRIEIEKHFEHQVDKPFYEDLVDKAMREIQ